MSLCHTDSSAFTCISSPFRWRVPRGRAVGMERVSLVSCLAFVIILHTVGVDKWVCPEICPGVQQDAQSPARRTSPRCIILAPTRELAKQVEREFQDSAPKLRTGCFYGGEAIMLIKRPPHQAGSSCSMAARQVLCFAPAVLQSCTKKFPRGTCLVHMDLMLLQLHASHQNDEVGGVSLTSSLHETKSNLGKGNLLAVEEECQFGRQPPLRLPALPRCTKACLCPDSLPHEEKMPG